MEVSDLEPIFKATIQISLHCSSGVIQVVHVVCKKTLLPACPQKETLLVFTVLAVVILSTFAGVAVGGAWFADARGNVLTGVELTSVHALFPKVACRKDRQTRTEFKPKGVKYRRLRSHTFLNRQRIELSQPTYVCFFACASYLGRKHRCVCSSRQCTGYSLGRCWSRTGQPDHSRFPHGSSGPEPCSHWPRCWMSHPYAHPNG